MKKINFDINIFDNWVKEFIKKHNNTPGLRDMYKHKGCPYCKETILKLYGNLTYLYALLGYKRKKYCCDIIPEEEILSNLKKAIFKHKTTDRDILRKSQDIFDRSVYERKFKSWTNAIKLCGINNCHRILMNYFDDYNGIEPIDFIKYKFGENNKFTNKQLELIEKVKVIGNKPEGIRRHIRYNIIQDNFKYVSILLIASGFEPNIDYNTGRKYEANDGHLCDSKEEMELDNWLKLNNFNHEHHIRYPNSKLTCDFKINNIYIEYAGLIDARAEVYYKKYKSTIERKIKIAETNNIKILIVNNLSEKEISNLRAALESNLY